MEHFPKKMMAVIMLLVALISSASAQQDTAKIKNLGFHINPLHTSSFKNTVKANADLNEHFKRPNNELMVWTFYPSKEWWLDPIDKTYKQIPLRKQLSDQLVESVFNSIIRGKTNKPLTAPPKF
jgi:hypothetical protein